MDGAEPGEQRSTPRDILASTGASILGLVLAGLCLILAGIIFLRRRRADEDSRKDFLQSSSNSSEQ
ncbi:LPXTG cell wall anchor domain-containing protein [Corynebacterium confusum]|uniref:LPXTG cell wall anchor domain-containing protein n=1 Tax=Corynebacterium confusum TaxID=71254 RepID=UPI00338E50AC